MKPVCNTPRFPWLTLLVALGGLGIGTAKGQDQPDTGNWACNFCTYASGWYGALDFGAGYSSEEDLKFADYRGIKDQGGFLSVYGQAHYRGSSGKYLDVYATDLGTDSRRIELLGGQEGRLMVRMSYREIAKYRGFGTSTPFSEGANSQLVLPAGWVHAPTTAGMSSLDAALTPISLDTQRKNFTAGVTFKVSGDWRYELDVSHMKKNGSRAFGAGVFTLQSSQFPVPVDFTTDRVDAGVSYAGERAQFRLGFSGSWFDNGSTSLSWENPFEPIGNTSVLQAALEPNSKFQQFNLTGTYHISPRVRLSGNAAIGHIRQDDRFLPYSINPDFEDLPLPRESLDQKIDSDIINLASRLSARISNKWSFNALVKRVERDNRTPVETFTPVITDLVQREETATRPYSFERKRYSAELSYRPGAEIRVMSGVKRLDYQRSLQSVRETRDTTWWGELNFNQWSMAQLRLRIESSERDNSPYLQVSDTGLQENPLMRKFNLADRQRNQQVVELEFWPDDRLSAGVSYHRAKDDYRQSVLGLLDSEEQGVSLDLSITPGSNWKFFAFYTRDEIDSRISGAISTSAIPWQSSTGDRFSTLGAGMSAQLNDRTHFTIDYVSSESTGRIDTHTGGGEAPFPELKTHLRNVRIDLNYKLDEQWSMLLLAEHENYRSQDWQLDGLGNAGISAILTLGELSSDYSATLIRLMARYHF